MLDIIAFFTDYAGGHNFPNLDGQAVVASEGCQRPNDMTLSWACDMAMSGELLCLAYGVSFLYTL